MPTALCESFPEVVPLKGPLSCTIPAHLSNIPSVTTCARVYSVAAHDTQLARKLAWSVMLSS